MSSRLESTDFDAQCMALALSLAERGRGRVSPNPLVGAVIADPLIRQIVGQGWHQRFGGPHAEVHALADAGTKARGATLYCTLEPCNHTGKTPPCAQAIIAAGVARVVVAVRDPNPVAAGGAEALRAAGVEVVAGVLEAEGRRLIAPFLKYATTGLPYVALKWAMTLDGKIATASGASKWISGPDARSAAHRLRAAHDAVLVGIGTLLADDPQLNARNGAESISPQPRRIVLDHDARTPLDARIWDVPGAGPVLIACADDAPAERVAALRGRGATVLFCERQAKGHDLLRQLPSHGVLSIFAEGGATVLGAFLDSGFADKVHVFVAPKVMGGTTSLSALGGAGSASMSEVRNLSNFTSQRCGEDLLLEGALTKWGA